MGPPIPTSWMDALRDEAVNPYFDALQRFVEEERAKFEVYPPEADVYKALAITPPDQVRVVLLGQDPYHDVGQAHGLCFSVRPGIAPPPSLVNIFRELHDDLGCRTPNNGYLVPWAEQGVLMLNSVLTVRAHRPGSHKGKGWETFTDAILSRVSDRMETAVFILWGGFAAKKLPLIDTDRHVVIRGAHPSPLSARNGFFGSRPFSAANEALERLGRPPIDWQIPDIYPISTSGGSA